MMMRWRFWRRPESDTSGLEDAARQLNSTKDRQREVSEMIAKHKAARDTNGFARDFARALQGRADR